jgi:glycosyltransferase involved in cell wall biosynthesis
LFLTHEPPLPLVSGTRLRTFHLMRELAVRDWEVSLFGVTAEAELPAEARAELERLFADVTVVPLAAGQGRRSLQVALDSAARRPFQRRYFHDRRAARVFARRIEGQSFDAIVAGQLYTLPFADRLPRETTVLDSHNVEARRVRTMARAGGLRGLLARAQTGPVERYERQVVARLARTWAVSRQEQEHFESVAPGRVDLVPNGVDCAALLPRTGLPPEPRILFLGRMDYGANVDAVRWLAKAVLPELQRRDAEVQVVGANPPRALRAVAESAPVPMELVGFVHDTAPCFESARLMVVPLRVGGGTRLKILESLARGVPLVTTALGCEGLDLEHGRHALIADEPAKMAAAIELLLEDDELCRRLAREGRALVEERYDWGQIGELADRSLRQLRGIEAPRPRAGSSPRKSSAGS